VIQEFKEHKNGIKTHLLTHAKSRIHLSFDLWTSPNSLSIIAVVAHYMGDDYTVQTRLIALKRLQGFHSSENMAECLLKIAKEYEITNRIGYSTIDNAESNSTCMTAFMEFLDPFITEEKAEDRRLRCWGHILNLGAKAFLLRENAEGFEVEMEILNTLRL
jgi:hypothetical protein